MEHSPTMCHPLGSPGPGASGRPSPSNRPPSRRSAGAPAGVGPCHRCSMGSSMVKIYIEHRIKVGVYLHINTVSLFLSGMLVHIDRMADGQ